MFVDWDTARRVVQPDVRRGRGARVERAISAIQDHLSRILMQREPRTIFRVTMRVYHGWHQGRTATEDRREFDEFLRSFRVRAVERVSFEPDIKYGDELLCNSRRGRLLDTLRRREDGNYEQKMVDTSLVSDVLHHARSKDGDLIVVVGDDDDLLPGVFTAEAWGAPILVARLRNHDNSHLMTEGLIVRLVQT